MNADLFNAVPRVLPWRRMLLASMAVFALGSFTAFAQDAADLMLRLDRLEAENRRLTGQVEEMRFANKRIEDQLKRFQMDADSRFRDLESKGSGGKGGSGNAGGGKGENGNGASAPRVIPNTPGAPHQLGGAPASGAGASGHSGAPLDVTGRGGNPAPALAGPGNDAKSNFAYAKSLIEHGDYENGEVAMRDFQKKYARDRQAAEATFWIGESFLRRTRYRDAAENFLTVTTKHSNIAKAPEAMLKLGISLRGLGANAEACGTFDQVTKKYPKASSAIRAAVQREKLRAKCS